jgi:Tol biopolymer transport system component
MSNAEFNTPTDKPTKAITNNSEITKNEKIILAILLCIMCLLLGAIGQKILSNRLKLSTGNNRLMVAAKSYSLVLFTDLMQYVFNLDSSKRTNIELFSDLPQSAELSPDGQWIVFGRRDSTADGFSADRIYIMRVDGTQQTLVPILYGGEEPTWSPDGKQIAFVGYVWKSGIYIANIECLLHGESCTPALRLLVEAPAGYPFKSLDWSPDGRKIAYTGPAGSRISVMYVDGQSPPSIVPHRSYAFDGTISNPQYSPDGNKIVAICHGPISGVCVMNRDGTDVAYLKQDTPGKYASEPRWSPDGQMIAFISTISDKSATGPCINPDGCGNISHPSSVFVMNADGSGLTHLPFRDNVVIQWFFWYP